MKTQLPIEKVLPEIQKVLTRQKCAVIQAPPGAGKTTLVPISLLGEPWLKGNKIVMLEPRRLAARASANRMADLLGKPLGKTVGYHIRMEKVSGPETKIEVVTEGILTRRIQNDPSLEGVGLVIFDEFHERNLNSDLSLALCLETLDALRDDLRLLVMSATLDVKPIAKLLGNAPVIVSQGKSWPVETRYIPSKKTAWGKSVEKECLSVTLKAISEDQGDILVFLPGVGEIKRLESMLRDSISDPNLSILPLYGNLSKKEQDRVIQPSIPGKRKLVLSTSISETSVTIDGIRIVIDSGLMRVPRFFSGTGMSRLETISASKASADQRQGRAGRTSPGICYRLWSEESHSMRKNFNSPEILNTDLARFALELSLWGVSDPIDLKWLDLPPKASFIQARELLTHLGAIDIKGNITPHGKELALPGTHPRLAHMILKGKKMGAGTLACRIAALLSERDFLIFKGNDKDADIRLRLSIIESTINRSSYPIKGVTVNRGTLIGILNSAKQFEKNLRIKAETINHEKTGSLLAFAYPERIAKARAGGHNSFQMASGSSAFFSESDPLSLEKYIVAADLDGNRKNARIFRASSYSETDLEKDFGHMFETRKTVNWDKTSGSVMAKKEILYGELVLKTEQIKNPDPSLQCTAMIDGIKNKGINLLPWTKALRNLQARVMVLKNTGGYEELPDLKDETLLETIETWLKPFLTGISSLSQLQKFDLKSAIESLFSWKQLQLIDNHAPTHMQVPSGSRIPLDYLSAAAVESPILAVRLQEMFGLQETPRIAGKKIPITLHLLSPARRPMQVTRDLKSFWKNTYADVKKDLKGRYPKHYWPDDPMSAVPTNRVKPKKT